LDEYEFRVNRRNEIHFVSKLSVSFVFISSQFSIVNVSNGVLTNELISVNNRFSVCSYESAKENKKCD